MPLHHFKCDQEDVIYECPICGLLVGICLGELICLYCADEMASYPPLFMPRPKVNSFYTDEELEAFLYR